MTDETAPFAVPDDGGKKSRRRRGGSRHKKQRPAAPPAEEARRPVEPVATVTVPLYGVVIEPHEAAVAKLPVAAWLPAV